MRHESSTESSWAIIHIYIYTFFDRVLILHQGDAASSAAGGGATTAGGATLSVDLVVVSFRLSMTVVEKDFTIS